jgi:hypothetical protein
MPPLRQQGPMLADSGGVTQWDVMMILMGDIKKDIAALRLDLTVLKSDIQKISDKVASHDNKFSYFGGYYAALMVAGALLGAVIGKLWK